MTDLLAEQEALAKEIASKKNCAKRKARRHQSAEAAGSGFIVVHASRSCEQSDEDVVYQHSFLEEGLNPKIDEALAVQDSAQAALDSEYNGQISYNLRSRFNVFRTIQYHFWRTGALLALTYNTIPTRFTHSHWSNSTLFSFGFFLDYGSRQQPMANHSLSSFSLGTHQPTTSVVQYLGIINWFY